MSNSKRFIPYNHRVDKGKSLIQLPHDYTVIDIETTGLDSTHDSIIEIAAIKIRNNQISDTYSTLIKPSSFEFEYNGEFYDSSVLEFMSDININEVAKVYVDEFITSLTGITNEMLEVSPYADEILSSFYNFIGNDILIGYNVNFDINFLYDLSSSISSHSLNNNFVDLLRLTRKIYPEFENHRLQTIASKMEIDTSGNHRALKDCEITFQAYSILKKYVYENKISLEELRKHKNEYRKKFDLTGIEATTDDINEDNSFFGKKVVFTGTLEKMSRKEAAQLVVNLGGFCQNGINKETNYLILGNNDYCSSIKDGKSNKQKKAEELKLKGQEIEIISENVFYDMLSE